jgi:hypothetical protein
VPTQRKPVRKFILRTMMFCFMDLNLFL